MTAASYRLLGLRVSFRSPDRGVAAEVERAYGACRCAASGRPALGVAIAPLDPRTGRHAVTTEPPGALAQESFPAAVLLETLVSRINQWCLDHCRGLLVFHAAAVARDGRALLLPAPSGAGKSTLAAHLVLRCGYELLSDEAGALELRSGRLLAFARALGLTPASAALLGLAAHGPGRASGKRSTFFPLASLGVRVAAPAAPALIVLPRFVAGRELALRRLAVREAARRLLAQAHLRPAGPAGLDALLRLAREVPCYRMTYGRLDDAARGLAGLWREGGAPRGSR